jgi:hypothetical protein
MNFTATLLAALLTVSVSIRCAYPPGYFSSDDAFIKSIPDFGLFHNFEREIPATSTRQCSLTGYPVTAALKEFVAVLPADSEVDWCKLQISDDLRIKEVVPGATELVILRMGICERISASPAVVYKVVKHDPEINFASSLEMLFAANQISREFVDGLPGTLFITAESKIVDNSLTANKSLILQGTGSTRSYALKAAIKKTMEADGQGDFHYKYVTFLRSGRKWIQLNEEGRQIVSQDGFDDECESVLFYFQEI